MKSIETTTTTKGFESMQESVNEVKTLDQEI